MQASRFNSYRRMQLENVPWSSSTRRYGLLAASTASVLLRCTIFARFETTACPFKQRRDVFLPPKATCTLHYSRSKYFLLLQSCSHVTVTCRRSLNERVGGWKVTLSHCVSSSARMVDQCKEYVREQLCKALRHDEFFVVVVEDVIDDDSMSKSFSNL